MSEQHGPARTPLQPEEARRLKMRRDKREPLTEQDFAVGDYLVTEYRTGSGRTARQLTQVVDVYAHTVLRSGWDQRFCIFGRVVAVQEESERGLVGHLISVGIDRCTGYTWRRDVHLRQDLDYRQEYWLT